MKKSAYITNSWSLFLFSIIKCLRKQYPLTHQNINIDKLLLFYCIIADSERSKWTSLYYFIWRSADCCHCCRYSLLLLLLVMCVWYFFFWFSRILSLSHSLSNRFTYLTNSTSRYQLLDFIIRLVLLFESTTLSLLLVFIFSMASRAFHMNVQPSIFYPRFSSSIAVALSSFPWEIIKKILSIHFWAQHSHATGCYANNASLSLHHITLLLSVLVVVSTFFFIFILISQLLWNA